jgi:hypothetical protein
MAFDEGAKGVSVPFPHPLDHGGIAVFHHRDTT